MGHSASYLAKKLKNRAKKRRKTGAEQENDVWPSYEAEAIPLRRLGSWHFSWQTVFFI
jgi:hypothetical protein